MNQTTKEVLGIFLAMWVVLFVQNLLNPDNPNKREYSGAFIGMAYVIGGRTKKQWTKDQ